MTVIQHEDNIHEIVVKGSEFKMGMFSDIHWDNPKCDWKILKKDLDYCLEHNIPIMFNGDTFCLMQGTWDPRKSKSDIRPEHNKANYFDAIVSTAVDFFSPYAHLMTVIGYGNHETAILKRHEHDVLKAFVTALNHKNNTNVCLGGYGGWIVINIEFKPGSRIDLNLKYFHGSGGGGVVTKGALNLTRAMEMYEGYDIFTMGHIHENGSRNDVRDTISRIQSAGIKKYKFDHKKIHSMITGTYKEEYVNQHHGWHVERGAPFKNIGGRILTIQVKRDRSVPGQDRVYTNIDSTKFPI